MFGAILGDIIGSKHEFSGIKTKEFKLLDMDKNFTTDDTYMTLAIAKAILESKKDFELLKKNAVYYMRHIGNKYHAGYGTLFRQWLIEEDPKPYNSFGNGSAMRVSACGMYYDNEKDVISCSDAVTSVTHNHPEGMKAAQVVALAIFYLKKGMSKEELKVKLNCYYPLTKTLDEIRKDYFFTEDAKETVPEAIQAFLEGKDFVDSIRNAISLGGDADTLACITGSLAGVYFGIPKFLYVQLESFIYEEELIKILNDFEKIVPVKMV